MCCEIRVTPTPSKKKVAVILWLAGAKFTGHVGKEQDEWSLSAPDGVITIMRLGGRWLRLKLSPSITQVEDHGKVRVAGCVAFKLADRLARASRSVVTQHGVISGFCLKDLVDQGGDLRPEKALIVASYPEEPLRFERICTGFREALVGGIAAEEGES